MWGEYALARFSVFFFSFFVCFLSCPLAHRPQCLACDNSKDVVWCEDAPPERSFSTRYSYWSSTQVQISSTCTHTRKQCTRTCTRTRTMSTHVHGTSTSLEPLVFIFCVFTHISNYDVIFQINATRFYVTLLSTLSV